MTDQRDRITAAIIDQQNPGMGDEARTMQYPSLDARQLIDAGVIRVVKNPMSSDSPDDFSIVTHWNDRYPGSDTPNWPNKPESYDAAAQALADPNSGAMYDGKYRQILWSGQQRGMFD